MKRAISSGLAKGFGPVGILRRLALSLIVLLPVPGLVAREITFTWDANTEPVLGGYRLYYGPADRKYTSVVDVGNQTTYTVFGLADDTMYCVAATAYDTTKTIESAFSNTVTVPATDLWVIEKPHTASLDSGQNLMLECKIDADFSASSF